MVSKERNRADRYARPKRAKRRATLTWAGAGYRRGWSGGARLREKQTGGEVVRGTCKTLRHALAGDRRARLHMPPPNQLFFCARSQVREGPGGPRAASGGDAGRQEPRRERHGDGRAGDQRQDPGVERHAGGGGGDAQQARGAAEGARGGQGKAGEGGGGAADRKAGQERGIERGRQVEGGERARREGTEEGGRGGRGGRREAEGVRGGAPPGRGLQGAAGKTHQGAAGA